ncbi:MAG: serine hydrolase domain-containing protein, partial [Ferruginibacter sp.]
MKKILTAVLVFLILNESLSAQNIAATNRLLDSLFKPFNNKNSPGYAITIVKDGKTIIKKDYGMASIEFGVPFAHNTIVRIPYSEGREFVSVAAAMMENQGILTLNDKVRKYFAKLPSWSEPVTIQDLLNHSSGFCDEWATLVLTQAEMANRLDRSQFMEFLYNQPAPQVEPGKGYMYSNSDFGLLRLILEKACGKNLSVYMNEKIFTPIGMNHTKLGTNKEEVIPYHAFSYDHNGEGKYTVWMRDKTSPGGNYWMLTSAADLEKWAASLTDKNSVIAKAIQRLKQNARPIPVLKGINYPFGNKLKQSGNYEIITHEGVSGYSWLTQVPAAGISIICLGNEHAPYADKIDVATEFLLYGKAEKILLRKFPSTPVPISTAELQKYAGIYRELSPT